MKLSVGRRTILRSVILKLRPILMPIAGFYRRFFLRNTCFIAVIGSFGKTTTTKALNAVLLMKQPEGINLNPESYVALDILRTRPKSNFAVFEAGIDRPGRMARFAWMIKPDIVVVTSIGSEHHATLGTLENTRNEKADTLRALPPSGIAVINGDDPNVLWMKTQTQARVVTFGFDKNADVRCLSGNIQNPFQMHSYIEIHGQTLELNTRLVGKVMIYPILAALSVAWVKQIDLFSIKHILEKIHSAPGRLQPVVLQNEAIVLRDDFKAPLETYKTALETFKNIPAKRRIAVIGEIEEIDGKVGAAYRRLGEQVASVADKVIFIGGKKRLRPFRSGLRNKGFFDDPIVHYAKNVKEVADILKKFLVPGDLVLLKGASSQKLKRVLSCLNGHRVECELKKCTIRFTECKNCPMLERGWDKFRTIF